MPSAPPYGGSARRIVGAAFGQHAGRRRPTWWSRSGPGFLRTWPASSWTGFSGDVRGRHRQRRPTSYAVKHGAQEVVGDAREVLVELRRRPSRRVGRAVGMGRPVPRREGRLGRRDRDRLRAGGLHPGRLADLCPGDRCRQRRHPGRTTTCSRPRAGCRGSLHGGWRAGEVTAVVDLGRDHGPGVRLLLHGLRGRRPPRGAAMARARPTRTGW